MLNTKDLVTKYRDTYFADRHDWLITPNQPIVEPTQRSMQLVLSTNKNLEAYGVTMSHAMMDYLVTLPESDIIAECQAILRTVKDHSNKELFQNATVFYPDFPAQVMEMSELEHYIYQMSEYLGVALFGETFRPEFAAAERTDLLENFPRDLKIMSLANETDLSDLMKQRMFANNSLPSHKMDMLLSYMQNTSVWYSWIHEQVIPNRENKAAIALGIQKMEGSITEKAKSEMLHSMLTEATDVLRFAAELSNGKTRTEKKKVRIPVWDYKKGETRRNAHVEWRTRRKSVEIENDPGLAGKVYFKLTRSETKLVNSLLNACHDLYTAIWLRQDLFKTFARSIHADESCKRLAKAYDNLFSGNKVNEHGVPIVSPYAAVYHALEAMRRDDENALKLTEKAAHDFPGVFNRSFIQFVMAAIEHNQLPEVCDIYANNCHKVPIRELLKMYKLIDIYQSKDYTYRAIHIAKLNRWVKEDTVYELTPDQALLMKSAVKEAIKEQLQYHEALGHVYLEPVMENVMLPENGERSASKGATLTSGSIIPGNKDCNIIRQFIGWQNCHGRIDVDTSAVFYDANLHEMATCSYSEHKGYVDAKIVAVHGGDITDAPTFSAEYLDIDKELCRNTGVKYVVLSASNYTNELFSQMDVAKFGFMERQGSLDMKLDTYDWNKFNGQLYEPETVDMLIDLSSPYTHIVPVIYDVENDQFIWIDKPMEQQYGLQNVANVEYMQATEALIHRYTHNYTPSFADLIAAYTLADKAILVDDPSQADIIFAFDKAKFTEDETLTLKPDVTFVSAGDVDYVSAELMAAPAKDATIDVDGTESVVVEDLEQDEPDLGDK